MNLVPTVNQLLGLATLLSHVALIVLISLYLFRKKKKIKKIFLYISQNSLNLSFIVALTATLCSLFYSEVAGYEPCKLCWFQRIFMYPLVFIFARGIKTKNRDSLRYGLLLAIPGFLTAFYHYTMQRGLLPNVVCSVVGYSASCTKEFVMQFDYITIPLMSLTAFTLIIVYSLISFKFAKK